MPLQLTSQIIGSFPGERNSKRHFLDYCKQNCLIPLCVVVQTIGSSLWVSDTFPSLSFTSAVYHANLPITNVWSAIASWWSRLNLHEGENAVSSRLCNASSCIVLQWEQWILTWRLRRCYHANRLRFKIADSRQKASTLTSLWSARRPEALLDFVAHSLCMFSHFT